MTGTRRSARARWRRRQLLFRAWHRGMREMDLILGRFAERIADLTDAELAEFERLLECRTATARLDHRRGAVPPSTTRRCSAGCATSTAAAERDASEHRCRALPAELLAPGRPSRSRRADGAEGLVVADLARALAARATRRRRPRFICRDGPRLAALVAALAFFAPEIEVLEFPAWDCLPYDRVSPHAGVVAQRMTALSRLARAKGRERPSILLTTVNAALQRVPARRLVAAQSLSAAPGNVLDMDGIVALARAQRLHRAPRRCASRRVRGARRHPRPLPARLAEPVRLDFFGDTLESIRAFDPETQRTTGQLRALDLVPMSEVR